MTSINKAAFRIIGLFAILMSLAFLAINISSLNQLTTLEGFAYHVIDLTINGIGIYGGFQLTQLRKIGYQLLIIWLLCRIFTAVFVILMLVANLFFAADNQFTVPVPFLLPLVMAYYVLSPVMLVYLLASRSSKELLADADPRHTHIVLRLLSLLTPGLARAWVSNLIIGMIFFYGYSVLMLYAQFSGSNELHLGSFHYATPKAWMSFFGKVMVWVAFAGWDWEIVKKHEKSQQKRLMPIPSPSSSQINGG